MTSLPAAAVVTLACYCITKTPQTDHFYEHYQTACSNHKDMASCADDIYNNCIGSRGGQQTDLLSTINYFQGAEAIQIKENQFSYTSMIRLDNHGNNFNPLFNGGLTGAGIQHAHEPAKEIFYSWDRCYNMVKFATQKMYFDQWFTKNEHFDFYRSWADYSDFFDYWGIDKIRFKETDGIGMIYKMNPGGMLCTAFAISPWHLLTASHCLYNGEHFLGIDNVKIIFPELGSFSVEATPEIIQNKGYDIDWVIANAIALENQVPGLRRDITYDYGIIKVVDDKPMTHFWKIGHNPIEAMQEHITRHLPHQFQISGYPGYAHYEAQYIVFEKKKKIVSRQPQPQFRGARLISNPLTVTIHDTEYVGQAKMGQKIYKNVGMSGGPFWLDLDRASLSTSKSKKSIIFKNLYEVQRTEIPIAYGIQSSVEPYADGTPDATEQFYDINRVVRGTTSTRPPDPHFNIIHGKKCCRVVPVNSDYVVKINRFRYSIIQSLVKYQFDNHPHHVPRSAHTKTAHAKTDYVNYKLDTGNLRYKHPYKQQNMVVTPQYIEKLSLSYLSSGLILVFTLVSFIGLALFVMLICTFIGLFTVYVYAKHYRRYKCEETSMNNSFV